MILTRSLQKWQRQAVTYEACSKERCRMQTRSTRTSVPAFSCRLLTSRIRQKGKWRCGIVSSVRFHHTILIRLCTTLSRLNLNDLYGAIKHSLEKSRTNLSELLNMAQPINRLPLEILCKILSLVPGDISFRWNSRAVPKCRPTFMQNVKQYRPLLLTCRHWNKLVMSTSAFWSTLEDTRVGRFQTATSLYEKYIARCPDGPLCIFVRSGPTRQMRVRCDDHDFTSRVRQIVFNCELPAAWKECNRFLSSSYPNLDTCVKRQPYMPHDGNHIPTPEYYQILPDSTRLRRLWIDHTNSLPATAFPSLVELRIRNLYLYSGSEALLCTFISNSPLLQVIELHAQIREDSPTALPDLHKQAVPLNALRDLTCTLASSGQLQGVVATPPTSGLFFRIFTTYFAIPSNCVIDCGCVQWDSLVPFLRLFDPTSVVHSARLTLEKDESIITFSAVTADGIQYKFGVSAFGFALHHWHEFGRYTADQKTEISRLLDGDVYATRCRLRDILSSPALSQMRQLNVRNTLDGFSCCRPPSSLRCVTSKTSSSRVLNRSPRTASCVCSMRSCRRRIECPRVLR
ncbi:hypothetical protein C8Q73DRAFT_298487 [Cubamyces lactineus]|nr:hypothetical protein C8Q73DRAFT_298487 [Cubamyces lactineus]